MNDLPEHDFTVWTEWMRLLGSFAVGLPAGILLDGFRFLRSLLPHHVSVVFLEDFLYALAFSLMVQLYASGFCGDVLRWYQIAGAGIGLAVYLLTIGRLTGSLLKRLRGVRTAIGRFFHEILCVIQQKIRFVFVGIPKNQDSDGNLQ